MLLAACSQAPAPAAPQNATVGVVIMQAQDQTISNELPGRVSASLSADIRPQVGGIIKQRLFREGTQVKAGQVLYQIDPATYQAAYASALATLNKAKATLQAAEVTAKRNAALAKIDAISQQSADDSQAALQEDQAAVGTAQAALDTARINLAYTRITAPIAGRVDTSTVTPGALVEANQSTALTTVQQTDTVYVDVTQSSADLLRLKRELAAGKLQQGGSQQPEIRLLLEDGSTYAHSGRLQVAGALVNSTTGVVTLRATVANPEGLLLPGMYVRGVLDAGVVRQALLVPQQALARDAAGGASVMLVDSAGKVTRRTLTVERAVGNAWLVSAGISAGERVIVEGLAKVKAGDAVQAVAVSLPAQASGVAVASATSSATATAARN
jgi:membrane fusion protein (multidrug efflux system)